MATTNNKKLGIWVWLMASMILQCYGGIIVLGYPTIGAVCVARNSFVARPLLSIKETIAAFVHRARSFDRFRRLARYE